MDLVNLFACTETYVSLYELMKFICARACPDSVCARVRVTCDSCSYFVLAYFACALIFARVSRVCALNARTLVLRTA